MAISRFQMNRQLRAYGGMMGDDGRKAYGIGSFFQKKIMDPIKKVVKSDAGKAAAAIGGGFLLDKYGIPGTGTGPDDRFGKGIFSSIFKSAGDIFRGSKGTGFEGSPELPGQIPRTDDDKGGSIVDFLTKKRLGTDKSIAGLLMTPQALAIGSGLLAGAFTKDKEDPLYTGQDVGLNLQDIAKLANVSDPKTAAAIGLRFSPDVASRKFTPAEMAATYAANAPRDFTEQRQQAQSGGIMGDQKDFEEFLQDMQDRDKSMLQDRILQDFEKFMKRKRMLENLPEAKDGGIMKARPKMASYGYNDAMSDTYSSYLEMKKKGLIPSTMTFDEFIQEVVPEMSKRQDTSGMMASAILGDESDEISMGMFGKPVKELNPSEFQELMDYLDDLQKSFRAKGGRVGAQEGGMMNLGGMEMDLRGGGFVPMGAKEKADDVPARLSKNEFVFTADAVRAAGGGDVDKGADKMYATMKKLEDRIA